MKHSGLTAQTKKEILDLAEKWWEQVGRHLVRPAINQRQDPPMVRTGVGPITVHRNAIEQDLNDGILRALPWEELKGEEQARIMFEYFSNIWLPAHPEVKLERRVH